MMRTGSVQLHTKKPPDIAAAPSMIQTQVTLHYLILQWKPINVITVDCM
jgi:hypothetical protein